MSTQIPFAHLHNHSHYSLGDAISQIPEIFKLANEFNMPAIALTDHGNMFGIAEFLIEAKKYPHIKPIVGCEIYLTHHDMESRSISTSMKLYHHLVLLVKNEKGYQNLSKMVSLSYEKGFYFKPRIDFKLLENHSEGLIATSACLGGEIQTLLLQGNMEQAEKQSLYFKNLFGDDSFYLELMNHGLPSQDTVNKLLVTLSQKTGVPLIATNDVHYPYSNDHEAHDVFLCIATGNKITSSKRKKYVSDQFYFKTYEEMKEIIEPYSLEALHNTIKVADLCEYKPNLDEFKLPVFETPNNVPDIDFLKENCYTNFYAKYKDDLDAKKRLDYEISVIEKMGFASYFLIVQDFILYAKNNNIAVGPGRGSAAGSIVAYLLGITNLDPLKYHLLFERFLNPGRISMPDIDTDFDDTKRDEVIDYVTQKYGQDKVAQIITFGRMKAKMVIRDVGRTMDIPLNTINDLSKLIPNFTSLANAYKDIPDFKNKINESKELLFLYKISCRLENLIRHTSIHAAGIIIGKTKLYETVPLYKDSKTGSIVTQFEGKYLEEFGLLKMDFLGLRNLRIINQTIESIKKQHNQTIDFQQIPLDDAKTYEIYQQGKGVGVFQCESSGIIELMKKLVPTKFEDIIALLALYRPGPLNSGMAETFIKNKAKPEHIMLPHADLKDILSDTYGVIVYQEQIMQISQAIAGFSLADADNLRKAMGKKDIEKMNSMRDLFIKGALSAQYNEEFSKDIFNNMAKFAEYGFNKSHSAAYALVSYQTAYLKAHFPLEYMACVLNAESLSIEHLEVYLKECKNMGITILPPNINSSEMDFIVENNAIRFGFSAIKNIGNRAQQVIEERRLNGIFSSFYNFIERVDVNRQLVEFLTISGTLDQLGFNRATIIHNLDRILQYSHILKANKESGMGDLFVTDDNKESHSSSFQLTVISEFNHEEKLLKEKEVLGLYASGHPLKDWSETIFNMKDMSSTLAIKEYKETIDNEEMDASEQSYQLAGRLNNPIIKTTKAGQQMALYAFEDLDSEIPVIIFPQTFTRYKEFLSKLDSPVIISGMVDYSKKDLQIIVKGIRLLKKEIFLQNDMPIQIKATPLYITLEPFTDEQNIKELQYILSQYKGSIPVILHTKPTEKNKAIQTNESFYIKKSSSLIKELEKKAFIDSVKYLM